MMTETKVYDNGTIIFLFQDTNSPIRYEIVDSGLFMCQDGNPHFGFVFKHESEETAFIPGFMFKELNNTGQLYKEGSEDFASRLRDMVKKRELKQLTN